MSTPGSPSDAFLDALPDNVLVTDDAGSLVQANRRARRALSLGEGPWAMALADLFPYRESDPGAFRVLRGEQPSFEDIIRGLDGRESRVLVRVGSGGVDRQIWLVTDLTKEQDDRQGMIDYMADLTTAQSKIRQYTRQIEVFRQVVNGMDQGIVLTDSDQRIAFSNAFANQLFGMELTGRQVSAMKGLLSSASDGTVQEFLKGEVLVLDEAQGRQTRCYLNVAPLSRDDPEDRGMVWTFFELTEEIANTQAFIDFSAELAALNRDLVDKNEKILHLSRTDVLTGVSNRRSILEVLAKSVDFSRTKGHDLTVVLFDLDRFKEINDKRGHLVGDEAIRRVCDLASGVLRDAGTIGRYGGEEFLVVLPGVEVEQARILSEEIRATVWKGTEAKGLAVTVTMGIATWKAGLEVDDLLAAADVALYRGKAEGRNRVIVAP